MDGSSLAEPGRLRWSKFFWQDWIGDGGLRLVSPAARGAWIDLIATIAMKGRDGTKVFTLAQVAQLVGVSQDAAKALLQELQREEVGTFSWSGQSLVRVTCRRMAREASKRAGDRERQRRHRGGDPPPAAPPASPSRPKPSSPRGGGADTPSRDVTHFDADRKSLPDKPREGAGSSSHASVTLSSRGEARDQGPEEDSHQIGSSRTRARAAPDGESLFRPAPQPESQRPKPSPATELRRTFAATTDPAARARAILAAVRPPTWRRESAEPRSMASLGSLLSAAIASPDVAKRNTSRGNAAATPLRSAAPPPLPFAIRDPLALARYAQQRGQVKPGRNGLLRALWAAVHAMREATRPAAMFWHLLREDPVRWLRARDDDDAGRLLERSGLFGAMA